MMEENTTSSDVLDDNGTYEDPCQYYEPLFIQERFWMVAVFGTLVSIVNIFENTFLSFMLFKKKEYRSSHMLYLALLAFFDVWIAAAYIPLMSLNLSVDYFKSVTLLKAWFAYMLPMITISHIAMTSSSFLMVAASVERYCVSVEASYTHWMQKNRAYIACFSVILGIACKFSQLYEMEIEKVPGCDGTMKELTLTLSELAKTDWYERWRLLYRTVITILCPFFLLCFTNVRLVVKLSSNELSFLKTHMSDSTRKSKVRSATRTLVFVVFTYLLANVLNVIVIFWEYIDFTSLTESWETFYLFAVDIVSLLTILAGALRLPIYATCQDNLRKEFVVQFKKIVLFGKDQKHYTTTTQLNEDDEVDFRKSTKQSHQFPMLFSVGAVLLVESESEQTADVPTCKIIRNGTPETCEKLQSV